MRDEHRGKTMSRANTRIILAIALSVAGVAPALAGANDDATIRRLGPTESISPQAAQQAPFRAPVRVFAGAQASAARVYPGKRSYHGTDPDPRIRSQLVRDCPELRV